MAAASTPPKAALVKWLFIGPPGVGKGTYAGRVSQQLGISHFASGTLLREAAKKETPVGRTIKKLINKGQFVTNETVTALIMDDIRCSDAYARLVIEERKQRFDASNAAEAAAGARDVNDAKAEASAEKKQVVFDTKVLKRYNIDTAQVGRLEYRVPPKVFPYPGGYILDGFPRTLEQAQFVDELDSSDRGLLAVEKVINLRQPTEVIVKKISGRRSCASCDMVYNFAEIDEGGITMPPLVPKVQGTCDRCGCRKPLITRADDDAEVVRKRLELYERVTAPLEEYYARDGRLVHFDVLGGAREFLPKLLELMDTLGEEVLAKRGQR